MPPSQTKKNRRSGSSQGNRKGLVGQGPNAKADKSASGKAGKKKRPKLSGWRKWVFRLVAMTVIPALFFLLLEGGLRLFGYGRPTGMFVKIDGQDAYATNELFGLRFFPPTLARAPVVCRIPAKKDDNAYRIFVLGGSAAQGTPESAFSISRQFEVMLSQRYPGVKFEVVNAAMTAINSHVVVTIANDCAELDPDLFVVYMGNNEVVGPYGAGTVFRGYSPNRSAIRAGIWVRGTRTGQLLGNVVRRFGGNSDEPTDWSGMRMFMDKQVTADDPRMEKVYSHLRGNLADICQAGRDAGAKVVVSNVVTNLKDCPPFASTHRDGLSDDELAKWDDRYQAGIKLAEANKPDEALVEFRAAADIDDRFADLHFRIARAELVAGRADKAREQYMLARDLDALRFRADTRINQIIREVAETEDGVTFVDALGAFEKYPSIANGIVGGELLFEHVHMRFEGNWLLARTLLEQIEPILPERVRRHSVGAAVPDVEQCRQVLAYNPWQEYTGVIKPIYATMLNPPFTNQIDHERTAERLRAEIDERGKAAKTPEVLSQSRAILAAAVAARPDDLAIREVYAMLLIDVGDYPAAVEQWGALLERVPRVSPWRSNLGLSLRRTGKPDKAIEQCQMAIEINPYRVEPYRFMADSMKDQGRMDEAKAQIEKAIELAPTDGSIRNELAAVLLAQGQVDAAIDAYTRAADVDPTNVVACNELGTILYKLGRVDAAIDQFNKAIELNGRYYKAYNNLATVLSRNGDVPGALRNFHKAIELSPEFVNARANLAELLAHQGDYAGAAEQYREILRIRPGDPQAQQGLARVLAAQER